MTDLLVTTLDDGVATLTLNRPNAIDSLSLEVPRTTSGLLTSQAHDDSIRRVMLRGEGTRGLSVGVDMRELSRAISDRGPWLRFLGVEYLLDLIVIQFPRRITAHLSGIAMGGGLGLMVDTDRRIVDSSTLMVMPETKIDFFPDAGTVYWLARAGALGTYMTPTSGTVDGGDALRIDLTDESADGDLPTPLSEAVWVQEYYTGDDPVEIARRLEGHPDLAAQQAGRELWARSPFLVHVTLRALRRATTLDLNGVLYQDLRPAEHMIPTDFVEDVHALLVDKDNQPAWRYATLEGTPTRAVDEVFSH